MRESRALSFLVLLGLAGCGHDALLPSSLRSDWKCVALDNNGNPFFGIHADKPAAIQRAQRECQLGSPFRLSCSVDANACEQLE